jgi:hypothetical protein
MDRREMLGVVGAGAAAGLSGLASAEARAGDDPPHHAMHDKVQEACMKACGECAKVCNQAAKHCLDKLSEGQGDLKHHARAHSLTEDCQAFCVLSATMIARGSLLMAYSCDSCAEACRMCAEECEKEQTVIMKECAVKCRDCERSCREMVRSMKGSPAGATPLR